MAKTTNSAHTPVSKEHIRTHGKALAWRTSLTSVGPNRILVRGFPVDEIMGRVSFAEAVYLLLTGELPTPAIGKLMDALLVAPIDHGATPPSTLAARTVATTGASLRDCVAAGILGFGRFHGGDIDGSMRALEYGVSLVRQGNAYDTAAERVVNEHRERHEHVPGYGHRLHTHDPRAGRLFQMALELDLDGPHLHMCRAIERSLNRGRSADETIPVNVDGAIAAICCDIGLPPELGHALFIIARVPGLIAQAYEEMTRERPMRAIDASGPHYDGPAERRVPETRK